MLERRGYGETFMLVNLMLCSLLGSITVLCSAAISNFIDNFFNGDAAVLLSPVPYLIIPILFSTGVLQLRHLDKALECHDNARVVPTYYVTFTLCSISGGGVVYQDFWGFTWRTAGGFVCGCGGCCCGWALNLGHWNWHLHGWCWGRYSGGAATAGFKNQLA